MPEQDWLNPRAPVPSLLHLCGPVTQRKSRLYAAASCRRHWHLFADGAVRAAIETAERHADGLATEAQREEAFATVSRILDGFGNRLFWQHPPEAQIRLFCAQAARAVVEPFEAPEEEESCRRVWMAYIDVVNAACPGEGPLDSQAELVAYAALVRCVLANPFRPVTLAAAHHTPTVVSLARAAYEERHLPSGELDSDRLAVLADALEDAGSPEELLAHLHAPGPHVRGCWAIDMCLGLN